MLNEKDFSEKVKAVLLKKYPNIEIVSLEHLAIHARIDEEEWNFFLDNIYAEYCSDIDEFDNLIDHYTAALLDFHPRSSSVDLSKIVPVIKDNQYLKEFQNTSKEAIIQLAFEKYNEDLLIFYAIDDEKTISFLNEEELKETKLSLTDFRKKAIKNLREILPKIDIHQSEGIHFIYAGGTYESSLILLEDIWNPENFPVKDDIFVCIPARDVLCVAGKKDINKLKVIIRKINESGGYLISKEIFILKNGKFEIFRPSFFERFFKFSLSNN